MGGVSTVLVIVTDAPGFIASSYEPGLTPGLATAAADAASARTAAAAVVGTRRCRIARELLLMSMDPSENGGTTADRSRR
jgi:hypothetical protein